MDIYIARQPILGRDKKAAAYELLYRSSQENVFDPDMDGDQATRRVASEALLNFGMDTLTDMKKGFINFTDNLLLDGFPLLLDSRLFVLEVLEDVKLTPPVIERLREYRSKGFTIAIDDYAGKAIKKDALSCFDIIKIDFLQTTPDQRKRIARKLLKANKRMLAEKIETEEDFKEAVALGCSLFQGYYFSRPLVLKKQQKNVASITASRLLRKLSDKWLDMRELTDIIRVDAHLTYKLLRKMRTVQYYRGRAVHTIKDALVRMGVDEIQRWMMLVLVQDIAQPGEEEQVRRALIRAVFCEKLVLHSKKTKISNEAFVTGMFSVLDLQDEELPKLLSELDLKEQVCKALMGEKNILNHYLTIVLLYESGQWDKLIKSVSSKKLKALPGLYRESVIYAEHMLSGEI